MITQTTERMTMAQALIAFLKHQYTERDGREVPMGEALGNGHAKFWLEGHKLRGGYALTRTPVGGSARERWLLVKLKDEEADARRNPVSTQRESVISGRTITDVRRGRNA